AASARNAFGRSLRLGWLRRLLSLDSFVLEIGGSAAHGNQFGCDANGDLFRGEGPDFQSPGGIHAIKKVRREAFAFERLIDGEHFALAADHAQIARLGLHGPGEHAHVVAMPARDDQEIGGGIRLQFGEGVFITGVDLGRHGEALEVGELLAIVDHTNGEAGGMRSVRHSYRDMPADEYTQYW